ncbi:MAG: energy transducer TonB [Muribaculaceae bacterium]|nr:energy transducer TonB [Muribaculaceae bacterium]
MARGKQTCKILKEIRRQIAEANGIEFVTSECRYKGDCLGTCPKCEAEVRYLEQQLRARSLTGKAVALAGISAGMILMSGCSGTSTKPQSNDKMLGETMTDTEMVEEIEEGEATILEDSVSLTQDSNGLSTIKNGEVTDAITNTEIVVFGDIEEDSPIDEKVIDLGGKEEVSINNVETIRLHGEVCTIDIGPSYPNEKGVYDEVDKYPEFPGGDVEMMRYINQNLKYPEEQLKKGIQGSVLIKFYVDTMGRVCEPEIIRSKHPALDQEALRLVQSFPDFTPGILDGKAVNTYMIVPVRFRLPVDYN